jgi:hypothetical protein
MVWFGVITINQFSPTGLDTCLRGEQPRISTKSTTANRSLHCCVGFICSLLVLPSGGEKNKLSSRTSLRPESGRLKEVANPPALPARRLGVRDTSPLRFLTEPKRAKGREQAVISRPRLSRAFKTLIG